MISIWFFFKVFISLLKFPISSPTISKFSYRFFNIFIIVIKFVLILTSESHVGLYLLTIVSLHNRWHFPAYLHI